MEVSKNGRNKFEAVWLGRSIDLAINELVWKTAVKGKFMGVQARWLLALELGSSQGNLEVAREIEEKHVGHDVNEAELIQRA